MGTGKPNGTLRALEVRILAYRERTGRDLDGLWIDAKTYAALPEDMRPKAYRGMPRPLVIAGVPVRPHEVIDAIPGDLGMRI